MEENITNYLPTEKINPEEAVKTLSKRESGALVVLFSVIIIILIVVIVYLAMHSNPQCGEEKAALRADNAVLNKRIMFLEQNRDFERQQKETLQDSLRRYELFEQFNAQPGTKQIILEPKNKRQ